MGIRVNEAALALALLVLAMLCWWLATQADADPIMEVSRPVLSADGRMTVPRTHFPTEAELLHAERVRKCGAAWRELAPWSYSHELVQFFVAEHERVGMGEYWALSMCTGLEAWGLRLRVEKSGAYSPMDQRYYNGFGRSCYDECRDLLAPGMAWNEDVLLDPRVNIRCHVEELAYWHRRTGRTGYSLLRKVFLPANPDGSVARSWGRRWPKQMERIEDAL